MTRMYIKKMALVFSLLCAGAMSSVAFAEEPVMDAEQSKAMFEATLKAAEKGNVEAMFQTAIDYDFGYGVEHDVKKAVQWYEKAAAENFADAMFSLGTIYEDGQTGAVDLPKAVEWYKKAAALGHVDAMFNLAIIYETGEFGERNYSEAFKLFLAAAEKGDVESMNAVERYYREGLGTTRDLKAADEWAAKAKAADKQTPDTAPSEAKPVDEGNK